MLTVILSSSVLYEMVGPVSAKAALFLSGSIPYEKAVMDPVKEDEALCPEMRVRLEEPDGSDSAEEQEMDAAVLPELQEYSQGVDERDDYDIERMTKPDKKKKKSRKGTKGKRKEAAA